MSTELDRARSVAERIAKRVAAERGHVAEDTSLGSELAAVREGLSDLQKRLALIEEKIQSGQGSFPSAGFAPSPKAPTTHSPWLRPVSMEVQHPSQQRFGVEEAVVSELVDFFEKEKSCSIEPGGKPCDHCEMCSSRGF